MTYTAYCIRPMRTRGSILSQEISYASNAARNSPTAVVKRNGKETCHDFLYFQCCKKFAHCICQRERERNLALCPHCHRKQPKEKNDELSPVEPVGSHSRQIQPQQQAINALQAMIQGREGLEKQN